jgi:hypothetical protein
MADFLIVVGEGPPAERWFARGLAAAAALGAGPPTGRLERATVRVASFARRNGHGGSALAVDGPRWALSAGTLLGTVPGAEPSRKLAAAGLDRTLAAADGFFALATGGEAEPTRLATDAIGSHQVHARSAPGLCAVAGSALWLASLDDDALDPIGCQEFLATGVIYEDRTPWAAVRALPAASVLELRPGGWRRERRWWSIESLEPGSLRGAAAVEAFGTAMLDTCARVGAGCERPVSDLTAGWDSRLLTAFLLEAGVRFETTVTGPADSPDVRLSKKIADALGLAHHVLPLGAPPTADEVFDAIPLTDGLVNAVLYARVLRVHRALSERFDTSLNGSFGEVARGYWWEILRPSPDHLGPLDGAAIARARYAAGAAPVGFWPVAERLDPVPHFADLVARTDRDLPGPSPLAFRLDHTYLRLRMRSWQGRIASSTDRLWPCLSPLIARPALEALLRIPAAERLHNRFARQVLSRHAPRLAALPLESGGPALPRTLTNAWRFTPELWRLAQRAGRKLLGRRTYARTLEETAGPRLALLQDERIRAALDPERMALGDAVDRDALRRTLAAMRSPDWSEELAFGNLLALELGLARARELRRG